MFQEKHQTSLTITLIAGPCDHIFPQLKNIKMPRWVFSFKAIFWSYDKIKVHNYVNPVILFLQVVHRNKAKQNNHT